jgi:hypothetical protein
MASLCLSGLLMASAIANHAPKSELLLIQGTGKILTLDIPASAEAILPCANNELDEPRVVPFLIKAPSS